MASTPSHENHQDEIREEIDSFLDRNFPLHYETFTNTIVHKLDQLLSKSQEQVYSHVLGYLSSHLMNAIDQKWTEHVRVSPGKFITNTQKKHAMIIDEINAIQEGFIVSYFQDLCEKVVSGATEALSFCKDKSFKLTTFVSEYLQDDDLEVDDKLSTARTKRRTSITTGQPEFKVVRESIEEIDETSELEDLKYMVAYGPLNEEDFTFHKYIKKNQRLQKYEEGHFIQDLNKKSFEASWKEEYEVLEKLTTTRDSLEMCYSDPRVQTLNRYSDVVPYKKNCVRLTPVFSGIHSYINASYVSSSFKTDSKGFIVCQAPLESTKQDFWAMVLQENVHTIVMLCKLKTDSRPQSSDYFGESTKIEFPWLKAKVQKVETPMLYLTKRTITLKTSNGIKRTVTHFQWEGWPDHGVPSDDQFDVLIYMVKEMMRRKKENKGPIIVHCSAGIGRSGALVALHNIAQIIKKSQSNIGKESGVIIDRLSVFSTVRRLRLERFGMVQTAQQYQLIYKLMACLLKNPKLLD